MKQIVLVAALLGLPLSALAQNAASNERVTRGGVISTAIKAGEFPSNRAFPPGPPNRELEFPPVPPNRNYVHGVIAELPPNPCSTECPVPGQ